MAPFRYKVKCRPLINCFEPKQLTGAQLSGDSDLRASMFGAAMLVPNQSSSGDAPDPESAAKLGLSKIPKSSACQILWEAQTAVLYIYFSFCFQVAIAFKVKRQKIISIYIYVEDHAWNCNILVHPQHVNGSCTTNCIR